jgi:diacylglycerol kinase family enzyme
MVVAVHNGPYVGTLLTVDPKAQLDDHRLDVQIFRNFSKWGLVQYFASAAIDRHFHHPRISRLSGKKILLESSVPMAVRADINDAGMTPVDIRSVPQALNVITGSAVIPVGRHLSAIDAAFG